MNSKKTQESYPGKQTQSSEIDDFYFSVFQSVVKGGQEIETERKKREKRLSFNQNGQ